jgi:hypothetical protein
MITTKSTPVACWIVNRLGDARIVGDRLRECEGLLPSARVLPGARLADRRVRAHGREQHDHQ